MTVQPLPQFPDPADPVWPALDRYLAGQATADDLVEVARWESVDIARRDVVRRWKEALTQVTSVSVPSEAEARRMAREIIEGGAANPERGGLPLETPPTVQVAWRESKSSHNGMRALGKRGAVLGTRALRGAGIRRSWVWPLSSVAALLVMLFVFGRGSSPPAETTQRYATGRSQTGTVMLDDGTRVTLAPQSVLRLVGFSRTHRTVFVDGEAYFEVAHAAGAPFDVRSGAVITRVLGTAFLVKHAPGSARVRVAVAEGKVRVFNAARTNADITVAAGYVGEVTDSSMTVSTAADSSAGTEWLHGNLVFYHMPVVAVLQTLSRWYGYRFQCADSTLLQRKVHIGLSMRSSAEALATLEQVLSVSLTMTADTVTLLPQRKKSGTPRVRSYDVWTPLREVGR